MARSGAVARLAYLAPPWSPAIGRSLATRQELFPTRPYIGRVTPAALVRDDYASICGKASGPLDEMYRTRSSPMPGGPANRGIAMLCSFRGRCSNGVSAYHAKGCLGRSADLRHFDGTAVTVGACPRGSRIRGPGAENPIPSRYITSLASKARHRQRRDVMVAGGSHGTS